MQYVRIYIYIEKKILLQVGTYCTYILYERTAPTEVHTACTYSWCTYVYWRKKTPVSVFTYLLLYVRNYCTYLVLVYLLMYVRTYFTYCCSYLCTYVPTVRTALTNAISTHLLHKTTVRTADACIYLLLHVLPVPIASTYWCTYVRKNRDQREKKLAGGDKVIKAATTPKRGRDRAKIIAQWEVVGLFEWWTIWPTCK